MSSTRKLSFNLQSAVSHKDTEWPDPVRVLGSPSDFASSFDSTEDQNILDDFFDLVYGIALYRRDDFLGLSQASRA